MRLCNCEGETVHVAHDAPVGGCRWCSRWQTDSAYRVAMGGQPLTNGHAKANGKPVETYPCIHRGEPTGERAECASCGGGVKLPVQACAVHGKCVVARPPKDSGVQCCRDCKDRKDPVAVPRIDALPPLSRRLVQLPGHFNAGMIEWHGRLICASRLNSSIYLSELDADFHPLWVKRLVLNHSACANGQEDPRLFALRGKLHVWFAGTVAGKTRQSVRVNQLYAELTDDFTTSRIFAPDYPKRTQWEKNWAPFEHDSELHCVYSVAPHVVLKIDGDRVVEEYRTANRFLWSGGFHRGGAAPVRVGDRYVHFTHGNLTVITGRPTNDHYYSVGLVEFAAEPPFGVIRQTPTPLMWASERDVSPPDRKEVRVVFPCGAFLRDGRWLVSMGTGDQRVEVAEFDLS